MPAARMNHCGCITVGLLAACALRAAPVVYISNCCNYSSVVSVFSTSNGAPTGQFAVGTGAFDAVFTPDGVYAYITNNTSQTISVVRTSTQAVVATIPVALEVQWIVITPDGKQVFAGTFENAQLGHIVAISTASNTVTNTLTLGGDVSPMAISPDGKRLYANYFNNNNLLVIDTQSLTVVNSVPIGRDRCRHGDRV